MMLTLIAFDHISTKKFLTGILTHMCAIALREKLVVKYDV